MGDNNCVLFVGNIDKKVTEEMLFELCLQVGPLQAVCIPKDKSGGQRCFAFVTFQHEVSVDYAINTLEGTKLFERRLFLKRKNQDSNTQSVEEEQSTLSQDKNKSSIEPLMKKQLMHDERHMMMGGSPGHHQQRYPDEYGGYPHNRSMKQFSRERNSPIYINDGSFDEYSHPHGGRGPRRRPAARPGYDSPYYYGNESPHYHGNDRRMVPPHHRRHEPYPRYHR